jgi:hypothetical protein
MNYLTLVRRSFLAANRLSNYQRHFSVQRKCFNSWEKSSLYQTSEPGTILFCERNINSCDKRKKIAF